MRVLHLTPELPYEAGGGGRSHEYFVYRRLAELGHQVLNISPVLPAEAHFAQALRDVGVENRVVERPASHITEAIGAVIAEPAVLATAVVAPIRALEMQIFWTRLRGLVDDALREWRPDVAVIAHDMAAAWVEDLPSSLPTVLALHNLTWRWYLSRAQRSREPIALLLRGEAHRNRRHLLGVLPRYRAVTSVSTIEADELRRIVPELPVSVIPTGVDTRALRPDGGADADGPPRLLFTGTLNYPPNSQGIRWFADRVWPSVRARITNAQLEVVGRDPPPKVRALAKRDGITVYGSVPSMAPHFARAHAVVVPILTGAGVRVKIVEAMAAGRAVVSTSLGWEGLPHIEPGRHLVVADEPADFAGAAIRMLREPEFRRRLAIEAHALAVRHYDWRDLGDEQAALLSDVAARHARSASAVR